jgi:autotransporter-associated beta strand protein
MLGAAHAADVNTTGGTTVINTDNPQNKYLGNGILQISADGGDNRIFVGSAFNTPVTEFAMTSGGLITIDTGVGLVNGGFSRGVWTNNLADLTINGTGSLDMWDGNPVRVDALNGTGSILLGFGGKDKELRVGVDGGSGTFSGNIAQSNSGYVLRLYKEGAGTQTFNGNLSAQIPRQYIINGGAVELSSAATHSMTSQFLGSGNLTKSGAGALTIHSTSGALMVSGTTNVTGGSLGFGSEVSARANLVAASGTTLGLNFTGQATVGTLSLGGSGPLAAGIYDSTHATYGSYFTGTGQLNVLNGAVPTGSGTWSSTTGGFWNVASRWTGGVIANGSGSTATIGAASAITVTLDRSETLGHLVFQGNNHTLNADNLSLTLAGTVPSVTVASGTSSRINAVIAGTSGLAKVGAGTLTLGGVSKTYTGGTAVNEGRLILANVFTGTSNYSVASGANLEFNFTGTDNRQLSGGTISGAGTLVKSGDGRLLLGASGARQNIALSSGALIDVQGGVLRGEFANNSGGINGWLNNKADLNVAAGAFFDIWDSNGIVDSISGAGTINKGWSSNSSLTFGVDNGSATFSGTISQGSQTYGGANGGSFNLIKNGTGTQTFSGTVNPSGSITVNSGTLQFAKTVSLFNNTEASWTAARINVKSAATLALNVDSAGTAGFDSTSLNTLLNNISVANTAVQGLQSGAILGIDTSTATGGTFTQGNAIANSTGSGSFHGAIGVTKLGTNTLVLDKTNSYTGATNVNAGTLVINGSISTSSLTTVASGATITGDGITGALTIQSGGFVNPGNSPGILDVNGAYTQAGLYTAEINGLTAGIQHDQINVTGTVNITGGTLATIFTGSYSLGDMIFVLLNDGADAITGTYSGLAQGATFTGGGFDWQISYLANSGGSPTFTGGNDIALMVVPEPGAALLGGLGMLVLLRRRRA